MFSLVIEDARIALDQLKRREVFETRWNHALSCAFDWDETPQGHDFWSSVADGDTTKYPQAIDYLEKLLA